MERHNRELRRREKLGTVWTERNLLALLQKQGLNNHHLKRNATPAGKLGVPEPAPATATRLKRGNARGNGRGNGLRSRASAAGQVVADVFPVCGTAGQYAEMEQLGDVLVGDAGGAFGDFSPFISGKFALKTVQQLID